MIPSKINSDVVDEFCFVSAIATRTFNDSSKILDFFGAPSERKGGLPLRRSEKKKLGITSNIEPQYRENKDGRYLQILGPKTSVLGGGYTVFREVLPSPSTFSAQISLLSSYDITTPKDT